MTPTLQTKSSEQAAKLNPANSVEKRREPVDRVPMSTPQLRLSVPEIPGFYCHWFLGPLRVQRALKAGYQFVDEDEVDTSNFDLAGDAASSGSTDLGSRLSVYAGADEKGDAQRFYLMKLPNHFREEDVEANINRSEQLANALKGGIINGQKPEASYIKDAPTIFDRKN